jgi:hypothetical protein
MRRLRRAPGFITLAVVTLGLGIGGTTVLFRVVDPLLLRTLPVTRPASSCTCTRPAASKLCSML